MTDFLTPAERSVRMSRIKGRDTRPEVTLRKVLHKSGLRYRLHVPTLPGKPDLVFPRYKTVVLVHGCFWHRHAACKVASTPKSNAEFWRDKFRANVARDAQVAKSLEELGWTVCIVWECELNSAGKAKATADRLTRQIRRVANS